jgi:hypothetical protein
MNIKGLRDLALPFFIVKLQFRKRSAAELVS